MNSNRCHTNWETLKRNGELMVSWRLKTSAFFILTAFTVFFSAPHPVHAIDTLTIAGVRGFSELEAGAAILTEAYRRIGIEIEIKRYPGERAIQLANRGEHDGDIQRIDGINKKYDNLIQIRPAINFFEASAFSAKHEFSINGWKSLRGYQIGIIRGMKFAEVHTKGMSPVFVESYRALLKTLDSGRIDVGILPRINGLFQTIKWDTPRVHELKPPLLRIELYHYVHRKNSHLVPLLSTVLKEMHDSGEFLAMREAANAALLKSISADKADEKTK